MGSVNSDAVTHRAGALVPAADFSGGALKPTLDKKVCKKLAKHVPNPKVCSVCFAGVP